MTNFKRIKGILSAKKGTQIPKFYKGSLFYWINNKLMLLSTLPEYDPTKSLFPETPGYKFNTSYDKNLSPGLLADKEYAEKLFGDKFKFNPTNPLETAKKAAKREARLNTASSVMSTLGLGADKARGFLFGNLATNDSGLTQGINLAYDSISSSLMGFTPVGTIVGGAMKVGAFIGDGLQALGGGTDQMTTTDLLMDSSFFSWNIGALNGFAGKRTQDFSMDKDTVELIGGSYAGTVSDLQEAEQGANKKYGLFSSGARRRMNQKIDLARTHLNTMQDIADEAADMQAMKNDFLYRLYNQTLNGGLDTRYLRAGKLGMKLDDKITFIRNKKFKQVINPITKQVEEFKAGGTIILEDWEPVIEEFKEGGEINWEPTIDDFQDGGKISFDDWFNSIPENARATNYDYKKAYEVFDWEELSKHAKDPENNHLRSVSNIADKNGNYPFLKLGKIEDNPEIQGEFDWYNSKEGKEHKSKFDIEYINDRYYYVPKKFKDGGSIKESNVPEIEETTQKNVIPEGVLHKNKHHIENTEGLTLKGIPVVDNEGNLTAEVEKEEIIFTLEVTKALEERYHKFYDEETKQSEKDLLAIEAGKLLVEQILYNTEDRANLIAKCLEGGKLCQN